MAPLALAALHAGSEFALARGVKTTVGLVKAPTAAGTAPGQLWPGAGPTLRPCRSSQATVLLIEVGMTAGMGLGALGGQ